MKSIAEILWKGRGAFLLCLGMCLSWPAFSQEPAPNGEAAASSSMTEGASAPQGTEAPAAAPTAEDRLATLETQVGAAALAGHNAWLLTCSALVLFMTAPGLAMFYSGLVRKKNVLGVMMQCMFLMGLLTTVWALWGYSLAFGGVAGEEGYNPWVGNGDYLFMKNVSATWDETAGAGVIPNEGAIPRLTHMLFQGMFFIITPALICGAFAERMKFSTMVVFTLLWGTLVYCPLCHWVWDGGILAYNSEAGKTYAFGGALDFAGGTVVHISSGVSALICALVIGKRVGFGMDDMRPHNLTYTAMGAAMLWFGWFGFNAGSELMSDGIAASAFAATHFAAATGGLTWAALEWITRGKPTILGFSSGLVAGLVCITPASGYVTAAPALILGVAVGIVCFFACTTIKSKFKYDDALDAFGVHGVGGTLGAILTGIFATRAVSNLNSGQPLGLLEGGSLLMGQVAAVVITWVYAIVVTFVLLKVLDLTMGLRVSQEEELEGLDTTQHGEEGYIFS